MWSPCQCWDLWLRGWLPFLGLPSRQNQTLATQINWVDINCKWITRSNMFFVSLSLIGKGSKKKKLWKSGQADRLGWPPPPLPRSGQENVKISRQVAIFGVILSFYKGQKWVKIFTNRSGQAEGGWPPLPPPKRSAWPLFHSFFFYPFPKLQGLWACSSAKKKISKVEELRNENWCNWLICLQSITTSDNSLLVL